MTGKRCPMLFITPAVLWFFFSLSAFAQNSAPQIDANTCGSPATSVSTADPFTTTFSVSVIPGDTVLSVVVGYRALGKTISSVVFNGSQSLTRSAGMLSNTMGAEIWSLKNPTATTGNIVITYTSGGTFVFDSACARTFSGVDLPAQSTASFTTADASSGISLASLRSTSDKAIFVDIAACNCGSLVMTPEANRTQNLNSGPNQVGSSTIIPKPPAGADTMPWTAAGQATEVGVVYAPLDENAIVQNGDPRIGANTCGLPAASVSTADPFTTTFP